MHTMSQHRGGSNGQRGFPIDMWTSDEVVPGWPFRYELAELDVSLEGRQLTVRGSLPGAPEAEGDERNYWVRSIPRGEFQRIVTVPAGVDADNIQATVDKGLLTLTLPKASEAKARKIAVQQLGESA